MSMVDLPLMQALLEAVKPGGCRLVMVGDPDQLPSVGPGNVLGDLLAPTQWAAVSLTEVFRQAERSAIIRNAHAVNSGRPRSLAAARTTFFLCHRARTVWCRRWWTCAAPACRTTWVSPADQIQVLSPHPPGSYRATVSLNRALQAAFEPACPDKRQKRGGADLPGGGSGHADPQQLRRPLAEGRRRDGYRHLQRRRGGSFREIDPGGELVTIDDRTSVYTPDLLGQLDGLRHDGT